MLLGGLVYANALNNPFVYDDYGLIVENRSLQNPFNLVTLYFQNVTRPLVNLSYAIDRALWGPSPSGFRAVNIVLHMFNVGLLYALAWRLTEDWRSRRRPAEGLVVARPPVIAFTAAVLLAVHPMMTQAVGYISGRAEVLCGVFFLLALLSARRSLSGDLAVVDRDGRALGARARGEGSGRDVSRSGPRLRPASVAGNGR